MQMPHESTVKHDEAMPVSTPHSMEDSFHSAQGRRNSYQQYGRAKSVFSQSTNDGPPLPKPCPPSSGAVHENYVNTAGVNESAPPSGIPTGAVPTGAVPASNHVRRAYPETPAEFTQTIDVYDNEDESDSGGVAAKTVPMEDLDGQQSPLH